MPFLPSRRSDQNFSRGSFKGTSVTHATLVEEPDQPQSDEPRRRIRHSPRLDPAHTHRSSPPQARSPQHSLPTDPPPVADPNALGATSAGKMGDSGGDGKRRRIVFLGSGKVGKTSLIRRFLDNTYTDKYRPTVEDLFTREFEVNGRTLSVEIMDTSGSYNFPAMRRICIGKASAFVLTCAQDDTYSFEYVKELLRQIKEERADYEELPLVIAVNKVDLPRADRQIADEDIDAWLHEEAVPLSALVYTSAKDEDGVWTVFEKLWERSGAKSETGGGSGGGGGVDFAAALTEARPPVSSKRRFSAFAVLTTAPGPLLRGSISGASTPDGESGGGGGGGIHWPLTPKKKANKGGRRFSNKASGGRGTKADGPIKVDCVIS